MRFVPLSKGSLLPHPANAVLVVRRSANQRSVAVHGPEEMAIAWVIVCYLPTERYAVYVYFEPVRSGRSGVLYRSDPPEVEHGSLAQMEAAALELVTAQDFMMEQVELNRLSSGRKAKLLKRLPLAPGGGTTSMGANGGLMLDPAAASGIRIGAPVDSGFGRSSSLPEPDAEVVELVRRLLTLL